MRGRPVSLKTSSTLRMKQIRRFLPPLTGLTCKPFNVPSKAVQNQTCMQLLYRWFICLQSVDQLLNSCVFAFVYVCVCVRLCVRA